jgi:hypothetical protein
LRKPKQIVDVEDAFRADSYALWVAGLVKDPGNDDQQHTDSRTLSIKGVATHDQKASDKQ